MFDGAWRDSLLEADENRTRRSSDYKGFFDFRVWNISFIHIHLITACSVSCIKTNATQSGVFWLEVDSNHTTHPSRACGVLTS